MNDEPEEAHFYIEGPDERRCVWIHAATSADRWTRNLGPRDSVADATSEWFWLVDYDEPESADGRHC
jgi:hypothetical protein